MMISIIIPFHKGLKFLEDTLQSLYDQTYKELELLLICDHIEEDISELVRYYQEKLNLKVFYLEERTGVAAARNHGLSVSSGEYIYFLDSDDYLDVSTLEYLITAAEAENMDLVYGAVKKTWFKRSTYLTNLKAMENKKEEQDADSDMEQEEQETDFDGQEEAFGELAVTDSPTSRAQAYKHLVTDRKGIRNITVLNILMKRSLIMDHNINFNNKLTYFSDYPFLFQVLQHAISFRQEKNALYIKRYHNDPINLPSLSQIYSSKDFSEYILAYQYTIALPNIDIELKEILDKKVLKYYTSNFAPKLHRNPDISLLESNFNELHELVSNMDRSFIRKYHGYKRRLYLALLKGDFKKSISIVKLHLAWRKVKKIVKSRSELSKALYFHVFLKLGLKENWVLCESFFGKSYSDNPKYIYEYMSRNNAGQFRFIWVINNRHTNIPFQHVKVKRFSIPYFYYLARSKYYVFNGRQPEWTRKRNGNIFLQTWHGTPLKRLAFDIDEISSATARYKKQIYNQSRDWDYLIAPNQFSGDIFKRCFLYDKMMLNTGYPRNDILHREDKEELSLGIKKKLKLPLNKKIILYAPTWRDDEYYDKGKYKFALQLDLKILENHLSSDYIILLRTHYFIADKLDLDSNSNFVYNMSDYDDIAELYLISDVLITDYSSVFFDYANLKRPMLFYMYDLEKYRDVLRGFYIDIEEELPGPILQTTEEVLWALQDIQLLEQQYHSKYTEFYNKYCNWEDSKASEAVAKSVFPLDAMK
jgi:CDP-glycerol glycerophosphotransferase